MLAYLANLTTTQIVIGLAGGLVLIWLMKVIFTRGGPRNRMRQPHAAWFVIPFMVIIVGALAWLAIRFLAPTGGIHL